MRPLITVIGPTAIGKSDLAVKIALHIEKTHGKKVEIISADSRQIYRHLNIGTGKITQGEMSSILHHMLDILEPSEKYSVRKYALTVKKILEDIYSRGVVPILCGGTGFYIDAVVFGNIGADTPPDMKFQDDLEQFSIPELLEKLHKLAQEKNRNISHVDVQNKRRIIRAIDILHQDGTFAEKNTVPLYNLLQIGLDTTTEKLRERIQKRLEMRIEQGMIEESQKLLDTGVLTHTRMKPLGLEYKYISQYIQGNITLAEFTEQLFFAIWHYAKRQRVWFRKYTDVKWFDAEVVRQNIDEVCKEVDIFFK